VLKATETINYRIIEMYPFFLPNNSFIGNQ